MIDAERAGAAGYSFDGYNMRKPQRSLSTWAPPSSHSSLSSVQATFGIRRSDGGPFGALGAAFFGYHLQGREDLAWYYSQEFVALHDDLAWGVCEAE